MAQIAYTDMDGASALGQIFAGKKFFLVQRLPTRSRFIADVEANGGELVKLEAQADYIIADHIRRDAPPHALSYRFIEEALREGELPSARAHLINATAASVPSGVSGVSAPSRSFRTPFTAEDDQELYAWVRSFEVQGGAVKGNEIYKQLADKVLKALCFGLSRR